MFKTDDKIQAFQDKMKECRELYGEKHMMNKGIYVRMPQLNPGQDYECLSVLHERQLDGPAKVDQRYQIVVPHDMELYFPEAESPTHETATLSTVDHLALKSMFTLMDDALPDKKRTWGATGSCPRSIRALANMRICRSG
jgi:hypothetical protein